MRNRFVGLILLGALPLFGQDAKESYYLQQAPVQETAADCFQRNLDEGLAAQKRGDFRMALRWFREAQRCPEVLKVPGRLEELNALIAQCEAKNMAVADSGKAAQPARVRQPPAAQPAGAPAESRRGFRPSRQFLLSDDPACFEATCKEAGRAFAGGYWDEAAALYRAAKNCSDADQADRKLADRYIAACREASQDAFRKKAEEAIAKARQAEAANRAYDAQKLLRNLDRSMAYRLADFANEYIDLQDNDACRQAMFDALYYTPSVHSGLRNDLMQIPFCYELGDNLDNDLQVCFLGQKKASRICAFARTRHLLFLWDADSFEPQTPVALEDTTLLRMDAVPDGRTLLFRSKDAFLFWRNSRDVFRLNVPNTSLYCFSPKGSIFYYLDPNEMKIYSLDLREAFTTRKGSSQRTIAAPTGISVQLNILQLTGGDKSLWLGYRDSIATYTQVSAREWNRHRTYLLDQPPANLRQRQALRLHLDPGTQAALFASDTSIVYFLLPESDTVRIPPETQITGRLLAAGAQARYAATYQVNLFDNNSLMYIYRTADGVLKHGALVPASQAEMLLTSGAFAPDNRLFATTTGGGQLAVWVLSDGANQQITYLRNCKYAAPSSDGSAIYLWRNDSLLLVQADNPDKPRQVLHLQENERIYPDFLAANTWVCYRQSPETIALTDQLGRLRFSLPSPEGDYANITGAFSPGERQFACLSDPESLTLYELANGQALRHRAFGNTISQINFVPQTGEILVVQAAESESADAGMIAQIWDFAPERDTVYTVRLQGYETQKVIFSGTQGYIAFTNGQDIRVFHRSDLLNEISRIRQNGTRLVAAMAFHPDGDILAAGYDDGSVIFWDVKKGQSRFEWAKPPSLNEQDNPPVGSLRFLGDGSRLQILFPDRNFSYAITRDLDVTLVRSGVQSGFRRLIAFQPSQIREFELEQALDYPNNFANLAASGDLPLIRSFFDYFRETALSSNNIQRVGNSCNRAAILFGQLDESTQKALRPILLEMLEDYHWKLLLRMQTAQAQKVAADMQRDFGNTATSLQASAHTALLRGDTRAAANLYAEWALRSADADVESGLLPYEALENLLYKLRQLQEYDLIDAEQLGCPCGLFGGFAAFEAFCAGFSPDAPLSSLTAGMRLRWNIFQQLNISQHSKIKQRKVRMLEAALNDARQLQRQAPSIYQNEMEKLVLALAQAYIEWGSFEQATERAVQYYRQATDLLDARGPFQTPAREQLRLTRSAEARLRLGDTYLSTNRLENARDCYRRSLAEAGHLLLLFGPDSAQQQKVRNEITGLLQLKLGSVYLLQGKADSALQAFEQAQNDRTEGIHRLYFGHAALLQGDEQKAREEYENIISENILGLALYEMEKMTNAVPGQRQRLTRFLYNMRSTSLQSRRKMDAAAVDFYWSNPKINDFGNQAQWDSALFWSIRAAGYAQAAHTRSKADADWQNNWLNALLNQSYYLLFGGSGDTARLGKSVASSLEAIRYLDENPDHPHYANEPLLKTNLAHAYWLRQGPGDRRAALDTYRAFLNSAYEPADTWELLLKDFRDLVRAGIKWPDLPDLIRAIRPEGAALETDDWRAMGLDPQQQR